MRGLIYKDALVCKVETGISMSCELTYVCKSFECVCVCGFEVYVSLSLTYEKSKLFLLSQVLLMTEIQTQMHTSTHTRAY